MVAYPAEMPRSPNVTVILTVCKYGDYLFAELQTPCSETHSDPDLRAITDMIGSIGPWKPVLKKYQDEVTLLLNWYIRKQKGVRPVTPTYDFMGTEAASRRLSREQVVDQIRDYVHRQCPYSDDVVQALIHVHDWDALARMLHTNMVATWQDRSVEGASVRVAHSTMHRVKCTWSEYIRAAPAQSEFEVRKGADQEVERRKNRRRVL